MPIVPALLIAAAMSRATPAAQSREEWRRYRDLLRQGNPLGALRLLQEVPWQQGSGSPEDLSRPFGLQILSEVLGAVGRHREAQEAFNGREPRPQPPAPPLAETLKAVRQVPLEPAEEMVLRAVREHQIVILNETHYQPEHRAFGARLIPRLRALGVRYFALETDAQAPLDEAMQTGRVRLDTDPYSWEPQRAELLRALLRAGMKLVAFDLHTPEEQAALRRNPIRAIPIREAAMARGIDEQILQRDRAAKMLVWVGMGHVCKQPLEVNGEKQAFMALRLWQRTGIEPFSIYQLSDSGDPAYDDGLYRLIVKTGAFGRDRFRQPMAVRLPIRSYAGTIPEALRRHPVYAGLIDGGLDAVILHPPDPFESAAGRPAWLRPKNAADIQGRVTRGRAPCAGYLVQALEAGDGDRAAPVDQVLTDAQGKYHLRLRPGTYRLQVWAPRGPAGEERVIAAVPALRCGAHQHLQRMLPAAR